MRTVSTRGFRGAQHVVLILTLLVGVGGLVACGDDGGTSPVNVEGSYTLRTANGANVPVTFTTLGFTVDVNSGTLVLQNGALSGTLSVELNGVEQGGPFTGTYTVNGSQIEMEGRFGNGEDLSLTGVINGDTITITDPGSGLTFAFRKN